jgi:phospholipid/cholesterol/gamma-HCH transport system ATP-binding protein
VSAAVAGPGRRYIEFVGVTKAFAGKPVLRGLDLAIDRGSAHYIIGTSGVGKSVTIKLLVGLLSADAGEIWFDGARVDGLAEAAFYPVRRRVGMVFQSATLFDGLSLRDNVALPLRVHRRLRPAAAAREAQALLEAVYLGDQGERFPAELSDGVRKRAAIARTLAMAPEVVLFDEPTTGLDPISARRIDRLIRDLVERGLTCVVVSHDLPSILGAADQVSLLYAGRVHAAGAPAALAAGDDPIVRQFLSGRPDGPMATPGF